MNRVFDLSAAASSLSENPEARDFIKAVRKFQSTISVSTDLADVRQSVDELREMREDAGGKSHVARALLTHAVIVYCRATHSKAIERYNVGVIGAYSPEQRKAHQMIVELRDKVLAHFGPGSGWHDEHVLYMEQPKGDSITAVHHRVNSDSMIFDIIHELLEVAIPYVKAREVERAKEVDDALTNSPELFRVIDLIPFDIESFYKDVPGGIENFWEPSGFSVNHTIRENAPALWSDHSSPKTG